MYMICICICHIGTNITITGINFVESASSYLRCKFNNTNSLIVQGYYYNTTSIICITPNISSILPQGGQVIVETSNNAQDYMGSGSTTTYYTYIDNPIITQIYPLSGPLSGGTPISIWGYNFLYTSPYFKCKFGTCTTQDNQNNIVTPTFANSTFVICISPIYTHTLAISKPSPHIHKQYIQNYQQHGDGKWYVYICITTIHVCIYLWLLSHQCGIWRTFVQNNIIHCDCIYVVIPVR